MISAKLIKNLERIGFKLDFPSYSSNEDEIIDILKEKNPRLYPAIPLLLQRPFNYEKMIRKLGKEELTKEFNKIIIISDKIFISEKLDNTHITKIINENNLKEIINENEFRYFYGLFKDLIKNRDNIQEEILKETLKARSQLNTNKALSAIFSPAKLRIMDKIFNHEQLTNTELKYYYKAIRPLILSILNENLQKYARIVESAKKYLVNDK